MKRAANKPLGWVSPIQPLQNDARRQQLKRALVGQAFVEVTTGEYQGKSRRLRRAVARNLGKKQYREKFKKEVV